MSECIDVKRFYIPGVVIKANCPTCGKECENDMGREYLSHPLIGEPERLHFFCSDECGDGWDESVILGVTLRRVDKPDPLSDLRALATDLRAAYFMGAGGPCGGGGGPDVGAVCVRCHCYVDRQTHDNPNCPVPALLARCDALGVK